MKTKKFQININKFGKVLKRILKRLMVAKHKLLDVTFRCLLMGTSKNEALKKLNNSLTYDRGVL